MKWIQTKDVKNMYSAKHLKSKFALRYKITQKEASKDFKKTFPIYFSRIVLQHFSNRPYPNVKVILADLYTIKII